MHSASPAASRSTASSSRPARFAASLLAALALALAGVPAVARPALATDATVARGLDYLHACQNPDGGFAEKGAASSDALTAWGMVAIAATGEDCNAWKVGTASPADFLAGQSAQWRTTTDYARTVLAVVSAGKDPHRFAGVDLVARVTSDKRDHGAAGDQLGPYVNSHIWALIALKAAGESITQREQDWLVAQQNADGGWGWAPGVASDTNDTAAALEALSASGASPASPAEKNALAYLRSQQLADGGFAYGGTAGTKTSDANSTSWVAQGLVAGGESAGGWLKNGHSPIAALRGLQASNGAFDYSAGKAVNPLLSTMQAIPALCGKSLPFARRTPAAAPSAWKPQIRASSPVSTSSIAWTANSLIQASVTDANGTGVAPSAVTMKLDGARIAVTLKGSVASAKPAAILAPGRHEVVVSATDRAGNSSTLTDWHFSVVAAEAGTSSVVIGPIVMVSGTTATAPATSSVATLGAPGAVPVAMQLGEAPTLQPSPADRRRGLLVIVAVVGSAAVLLGVGVWLLIRAIRRRRRK